ncbi:MAG: hypothetical protein Q4G69_06645 [Planctomycetia bacterium]|nr:hypothetical protein [Planctomycetia bacterium]
MKRQTTMQKERGVALLLILGLMAMFAMMVLAFMIITSNMAETARLNAEAEQTALSNPKSDLDHALRTLMIGTNNRQCPIGPFSILENLYGDYRDPGNRNETYTYWAAIVGSNGLADFALNPDNPPNADEEKYILVYPCFADMTEAWQRYQEAGSVLTFGETGTPDASEYNTAYFGRVFGSSSTNALDPVQWNKIVSGTSVPVLSKEFISHDDSVPATGKPVENGIWGFKVSVPESVIRYIYNVKNFSGPYLVKIRFNLPQYSGTGAGYFKPNDSFYGTDNQLYQGDTDALGTQKHYLFHLYDWANASAPDPKTDTIPVTGETTAQTFWCHLYNPVFKNPGNPELLRMNPSYTAPDNRSLFLAWYPTGIGSKTGTNDMTPSFHRMYKFLNAGTLADAYQTLTWQETPGDAATSKLIFNITSLNQLNTLDTVRKMTPRPLPLDHWNFSGGNENLKLTAIDPDANKVSLFAGTFNSKLNNYTKILCQNLAWDYVDNLDVDNDNDGLKEGVWIPSGLPVRTAADGTPYFTMYSYTVVDMDGKVNVNTAGNWDQLPARGTGGITEPYHSLNDLISSWTSPQSADASDDLIYYSEKISDKIGWKSDMNADISSSSSEPIIRGAGHGTSGVLLDYALKSMLTNSGLSKFGYLNSSSNANQLDCASIIATNLVWRRYDLYENREKPNPSNELVWSKTTEFALPGNDASEDPSLKDHRFHMLTNHVKLGTVVDQSSYIFPWRGKMRIPYGQDNRIPLFNFTDSALTTYDPLGHSVFTYSPMFSINPYFFSPLDHSVYDSPYSSAALETILRSRDADFGSLPKHLLYDLFDMDHYAKSHTPKEVEDLLNTKEAKTAIQKLADTITTDSVDIPVASILFADKINDGNEFNGYGAYGITALIKKCVGTEFKKCGAATGTKADEVTRYLVSLLPEEILAGHKLNLNRLADKSYWLDLVNDGADNYSIDRNSTHNYGLAKKMEFARGLYILIMALTYQDRNADLDTAQAAKTPPETPFEKYFEKGFNEKIDSLLEGIGKSVNDDNRSLLNQELIANRIAQWCVNLVDFSDQDATMTPFFYDPNPFDGWWITDTSLAGCGAAGTAPTLTPLFNGYTDTTNKVYVNPKEQMAEFFKNLLDTPDAARTGNLLQPGIPGDVNKQMTFATATAWWMQSKTSETKDANSKDLGFRMIWGMERPDLLLTETLNWHDLGVANTQFSTGDKARRGSSGGEWWNPSYAAGKTEVADSKEKYDEYYNTEPKVKYDPHFDQVKRPRGVSFLELYCTANPNIPQSTELYDYNYIQDLGSHERTDLPKQWQLNLAKTTPGVNVQPSGGGGTRSIEFPVWRITVTDSAVWGDGVNYSAAEKKYKKPWNSILYHLAAEIQASEKTDYQTFSFQTKQFRDFPANWSDFADIPVSSILGPTYVKQPDADGVTMDMIPERHIWFGAGFKGTENTRANRASYYPDAKRTFAPLNETWSTFTGDYSSQLLLSPNQYLIVGPAKEEAIGSLTQASGTVSGVGGWFGVRNYCQPSTNTISIRNYEYNSTNILVTNIETVKMDGTNPKIAMNSKYVLAGSVVNNTPTVSGVKDNNSYFNISEPLWQDTTDPYGSTDFTSTRFYSYNESSNYPYPDVPYDLPEGTDWGDHAPASAPAVERPIAKDCLFGLGTVPGYKSACLQRVADPNRGYHPIMNPYITVDWNMMDLTVFNGAAKNDGNFTRKDQYRLQTYQSTENRLPLCYKYIDESLTVKSGLKLAGKGAALFDATSKQNAETPIFSSRQWGRKSQKGFCPDNFSPRNNPLSRAFSFTNMKGTANFFGLDNIKTAKKDNDEDYDLSNNSQMSTLGEQAFPARPWNTLGAFNNLKKAANPPVDRENENMSGTSQIDNSTYSFGDVYWRGPAEPVEHLIWNDAPFSNPAEIALVPASAPGRFGLEFVHRIPTLTSSDIKEYNLGFMFHQPSNGGSLGSAVIRDGLFGADPTGGKTDGTAQDELRIGPYFNFFHSAQTPGQSLNLGQLLDFVQVPSNYAGSWDYAGKDTYGYIFHTKLRDPGKININTATQSAWSALVGDANSVYKTATAPDISLYSSRDWFSSTRWIQNRTPFQPVNTGMLNTFHNEILDPADNTKAAILPGDFSLLRRWTSMANDSTGTASTDPANPDLIPLFARDREGNLRKATETIQRLSGLTTNRSNVFAVWITVGYFEAERCKPGTNMPAKDFAGTDLADGNGMPKFITDPNNYANTQYYRAIYPDGYTYGKELGLETGEVKRHRGFYIIDRSIPVDFRRGQSWNWKNTILTERQID